MNCWRESARPCATAAAPEELRLISHIKQKGLVIDFDKRLVTVDGESVHLTQVEFKNCILSCEEFRQGYHL